MKHINVMLMLLIIMVILLGCGQMNTDSEDKTVEPEQTAVGTTSAEKAESQSFKVIEIQNFDGERGAVFEREGVNNAKTASKIAGAILEQYQEEGHLLFDRARRISASADHRRADKGRS